MASGVTQKRQDDHYVRKAFDDLAIFENEMRKKADQLSAAGGMTPEQIAEHMRPKEAERLALRVAVLNALDLDPSFATNAKVVTAFNVLAHVEFAFSNHRQQDYFFLRRQVKDQRLFVIQKAFAEARKIHDEIKKGVDGLLHLADTQQAVYALLALGNA